VQGEIEFYTNDRWRGGGLIPPELRRIDDLSAWIALFLSFCAKLGKEYAVFSSNDGALIGQEKASLARRLEAIIGALAVFHLYCSEGNSKSFDSLADSVNYSFSLKVDYNTWQGKGVIKTDESIRRAGFAAWYKDVLCRKLKEAFHFYAEANSDGVVTPTEQRKLIGFVEQIIADVLIIDKILVTENVSS
jgi:hypothetical protein